MRTKIYLLFSLVLMLAINSCQKPDELLPSVSRNGVNSITATFEDGTGSFTGYPVEGSDVIVIPVPYYFPESSDNVTPASLLNKMRVVANLDDNVTVSPAILYMDLSQDNVITVTDQLKQKKTYKVRGEIRKSSACSIEEFKIPSLGLTGIINEDTKTIAIIAAGTLQPALASYRLSYHATVSPDPAVTALNYNNDVTLTVTANDGVTKKVYTVKKQIPDKIPFGIRSGSQTLLWGTTTLNSNPNIVKGANINYTLGVLGDYLLLATGNSNINYINKTTGEFVGKINMNGVDLLGGAITSDKGGNVIMCNSVAKGGVLKLYKLTSVTGTPQEILSWTYNIGAGARIGYKISVAGDINHDAIITINDWYWTSPAACREFLRIKVTNGVLGAPEAITLSGTYAWNGGNVDVVYASADPASDIYVTSYSGNSLEVANGATLAQKGIVGKGANDANSNFACVDFTTFNKGSYVAVYGGSHFTYSATRAMLFDVSTLASFTGTFDNSPAKIFTSPVVYASSLSGTAYPDVLLSVSDDGFMLYMFYVGSNNGLLQAYQFDCIDK
jgi:hypothetical protein